MPTELMSQICCCRKRTTLFVLFVIFNLTVVNLQQRTHQFTCFGHYQLVQIILSSPIFTYEQFVQTLTAHSILSNCSDSADERKLIYSFGFDQVDAYADIYDVYNPDQGECTICGIFTGNVSYAMKLYAKSLMTNANLDKRNDVTNINDHILSRLNDLRDHRRNIDESYPYCMSLTLITDFKIVDFATIKYNFSDYKDQIQLAFYLITNDKTISDSYPKYLQKSIISINSSETENFDLCNQKTQIGMIDNFLLYSITNEICIIYLSLIF